MKAYQSQKNVKKEENILQKKRKAFITLDKTQPKSNKVEIIYPNQPEIKHAKTHNYVNPKGISTLDSFYYKTFQIPSSKQSESISTNIL